jgi:antitoxin component YwqK of YwqJK toxin-antitoxin module
MKSITTFIFSLILNLAFCQSLKISDFTSILNKKSWEEINEILQNKGWEYYNSKTADYELQLNDVVIWSFNKSEFDKARGWIEVGFEDNFPIYLNYQVFNKTSFNQIESSIKSGGFKKISSEIGDENVTVDYASDKYSISLSYNKFEKEDFEDADIGYVVLMTKKQNFSSINNGLQTVINDDNQVVREFNLKDGKLDGKMVDYHENGEIKVISYWKNDQRNGTYQEWNENGQLENESNCLNDALNGPSKEYKDGKLYREANYRNGLLYGIEKFYHSNGQLKSKVNLVNGQEEGPFILYNERGIQIVKLNYSNGIKNGAFEIANFDEYGNLNGIETGYYIQDEIEGLVIKKSANFNDTIQKGYYKNGKRSGRFEEFDRNILKIESYYDDGQLNGLYREFCTEGNFSGKPMLEINFKNGKKHGDQKRFLEVAESSSSVITNDLTPVFELTTYENGIKNGSYRYEKAGKLITKGQYSKGEKVGEWLEYNSIEKSENNSSQPIIVKTIGNYNKNKKEGIWKGYNEENLFYTSNYSNGLLNGDFTLFNKDGSINLTYVFDQNKLNQRKYFDNNVLLRTIKLSRHLNNYQYIEVESENENSNSIIEYVIEDKVKFEDDQFVNYFEKETFFMTKNDPYSQMNKHGYFYYSIDNKIFRGNFVNNVMDGKWSIQYKNEGVIQNIQYNRGIVESENFTELTGQGFNGILEISDDQRITKIKIKNGLRHGKTITEFKGETIKIEKYSNGIKVN